MSGFENSYGEVISEGFFARLKIKYLSFVARQMQNVEEYLITQGYLLVAIGFLLGRAEILSKFMPFALAYFAAVLLVRRARAPHVLIGLMFGAATIGWQEAAVVLVSATIFVLLNRIYSAVGDRRAQLVGGYVFATHFSVRIMEKYLLSSSADLSDFIMVTIEASLALVLTLMFIQCIPLFSFKRRATHLKTEEVISLAILVSSILTGTVGWHFLDISFGNVLSRYLVLIFAAMCGASIGTTVGVVTGLIFSLSNLSSLYQISLLAFAGLLGGLLKDGKRLGASLGLFIATILVGLYADGKQNLVISLYETSVATMLFFLTPQILMRKLAKAIPGTEEYNTEQQKYVRKVRDVTANRVNQFSDVFQALSHSFSNITVPQKEVATSQELDLFFSKVTEKSCQSCFKKTQCWGKNFDETYSKMKDLMADLQEDPEHIPQQTKTDWKRFCVKFDRVTDSMNQELATYVANQKLKKQVHESRKLVAEQLQGVSKVMEDFAKEIQKDRNNLQVQEDQIYAMMNGFGIEIEQIDIFSLEERSIDIEMSISDPESLAIGEKLVAPMLSEILGEYVQLQAGETEEQSYGSTRLVFRSAKKYCVETGVAHAAKGGGLISGDSYTMIDIGKGKHAIAISDGMGNGARAHAESTETLQLLQKILASGIEEKVAIRSINSILSLRTTDEVFSTLDLAMIDLQDGRTKFLKIGSTPSFIRRENHVRKIQGSNLPIGIVKEFDVDVIQEQLLEGDLLIMMSDGIFEGPKFVENYEVWMNRKIRDLKTFDPQAVADLILEEVVRTSSGEIEDDMTVIVALIKTNVPKWSNIKAEKKGPSKKRQFAY